MLNRKLHAFSIITRSICVTIRYSCVAIYRSYLKRSRAQIDEVIRAWATALLRIVDVTVKVHNPHGTVLTPGHSYLLMSNHTSLYDIPLIFEAIPGSIRMIAKKELLRVPVWGHAMKASEFLGIDRKNSEQAIKDLAFVREKMKSGIVPWIAPEGTRSRDGNLGVFKKGGFMLAIETRATIIPISIRGAAKILPPKTLDFQMGQTVEIFIGKPVDAAQYSIAQRNALLQEVRQQIEGMLNS